MTKAIVLALLKTLGSDILLMILERIALMLKQRDDNTMFKDADEIRRLSKRNHKK